jgi:hypothetical protein
VARTGSVPQTGQASLVGVRTCSWTGQVQTVTVSGSKSAAGSAGRVVWPATSGAVARAAHTAVVVTRFRSKLGRFMGLSPE